MLTHISFLQLRNTEKTDRELCFRMGLVERAERQIETHIIITRSLPTTCQHQLSSTEWTRERTLFLPQEHFETRIIKAFSRLRWLESEYDGYSTVLFYINSTVI